MNLQVCVVCAKALVELVPLSQAQIDALKQRHRCPCPTKRQNSHKVCESHFEHPNYKENKIVGLVGPIAAQNKYLSTENFTSNFHG
jgi:hypothetical protein